MSRIKPNRGCTSATLSLFIVAPLGPLGKLFSVNLPASVCTVRLEAVVHALQPSKQDVNMSVMISESRWLAVR